MFTKTYLVVDDKGNREYIEARRGNDAIQEAQDEYGFGKIRMCIEATKPKEKDLTKYFMEA